MDARSFSLKRSKVCAATQHFFHQAVRVVRIEHATGKPLAAGASKRKSYRPPKARVFVGEMCWGVTDGGLAVTNPPLRGGSACSIPGPSVRSQDPRSQPFTPMTNVAASMTIPGPRGQPDPPSPLRAALFPTPRRFRKKPCKSPRRTGPGDGTSFAIVGVGVSKPRESEEQVAVVEVTRTRHRNLGG